jgi:hypothetical protein
MEQSDQVKMFVSMFVMQIPVMLVCLAAFVVIPAAWTRAPRASLVALLGFGLAFVLCFAIPMGQTALQIWMRGGHAAEKVTVMTAVSVMWSVLRAVSYGLLLLAVFMASKECSNSRTRNLS